MSEPSPDRHPEKSHSNLNLSSLLSIVTLLGVSGILFYLAFSEPIAAGPFMFSAVAFILIWPIRQHPVAKSLMYGFVFILLYYIISELRIVLIPFVVSFMIAYLMAPIMDWFRRFKVPSAVAALLVTLIFLGILVFSVVLIGPIVGEQMKSLANQWTTIHNFIPNLLNEPEVRKVILGFGIDPNVISFKYTHGFIPALENAFFNSDGLISSVPMVATIIINTIISLVFLPFLLFYFMKDYEDLVGKFRGLIPDERRQFAEFHSKKLQRIISTYVRGQLLIALIGSIMCLVPFLIFSVPYALVLAIGFLIFSLIPYVGVILMLFLGVLFSSTSSDFIFHATVIGITFLTVTGIQNFILTPKILGDQVGLHPVFLILSISVFGYFLGALGMLIAIPLTAAINVYFKDWLATKNRQFAERQGFKQ